MENLRDLVEPIWVSLDGEVFWTEQDIGTAHLENIVAYIPKRLKTLKFVYKTQTKSLKERRKKFVKELKRREKELDIH
jgi:hypothetical protein